MKYSKELLKGTTPILVMSTLKSEDLYGYKIIRELKYVQKMFLNRARARFIQFCTLRKRKSYYQATGGRLTAGEITINGCIMCPVSLASSAAIFTFAEKTV